MNFFSGNRFATTFWNDLSKNPQDLSGANTAGLNIIWWLQTAVAPPFYPKNYYKNTPFKNSEEALYHWSPISDELKALDKEIVLNSIKLKWNLVKNEFQELTKNLYFN